jgi:3-oxoacyl-[acyl-carrier-protein] synthase-3
VAFLRAFGHYLPERVVSNQEFAAAVGCAPEWIREVSGIEERRFAGESETVTDLAARAAEDCLRRAGLPAGSLGMILVSSGSAERRFPGPASSVASRLGLDATPAIDLPIASAGTLFALHLAARLASDSGPVLVVGAEKMSTIALAPGTEPGTAVLFGDGAGACLVSPASGVAEILDSAIYSDGSFAEELRLEFGSGLQMNGRAIILQASRKIPRAIEAVLGHESVAASQVGTFLLHQANLNLIRRVAQALSVPAERFYTNLQRYGNTSSASLLIAASEWASRDGLRPGEYFCLAAFGAGLHWGAMLARGA